MPGIRRSHEHIVRGRSLSARPLARAVRGLVAILALFLVAIMSQLSPQASADENKSVNVSNLSLTRVDGNNIEQDGKLSYYDLARLSFDWSGVDATSVGRLLHDRSG